MDTWLTGLSAPVALASVALLGYLVGLRQRRRDDAQSGSQEPWDDARLLISQVESVSEQLRCSMAAHHSTVTRCQEQIQRLSQRLRDEPDTVHPAHWEDILAPTQRLTDDIAHAYDELRRHTHALRRLRGDHEVPVQVSVSTGA